MLLTFVFILSCSPSNEEYWPPAIDFDDLVPAQMNEDLIQEMEYFINSGKYGPVYGVLVIQDGKNIFEKYYNDANAETLIPLYSATSFVSSSCIGMAYDQGLISSQDLPVVDFFQDISISEFEQKKSIHLHHLLSQSTGVQSGMEWRDQEQPFSMIFNSEMISNPGEQYISDPGMSFLLGEILNRSAEMKMDSFAYKYLFEPLGIEKWEWEADEYNRVHTEGFYKGLWLTTRDFAKIGMLYLQNGKWKNQQLISDYWVTETMKPWMYMNSKYHQGYYCRILNPSTTTPMLYETKVVNVNGLSQNLWLLNDLNTLVVVTADRDAKKDRLSEFLTHYILPSVFNEKALSHNVDYNYEARLIDSIEIDGDLTEWEGFDVLMPGNPVRIRNSISSIDYDPQIKIGWSKFRPTKIFISAEIVDDILIEDQAINDHIDISLDLLNTGRTYQWVFNSNGTFYGDVANETNTRFEVVISDDRYFYEIEIDLWEGKPVEYDLQNFYIEPGNYIGLKIDCTDVDDIADVGTVIGWSTDDDQDFLFNDYTRPALYGSVFFTNN